MRLQHMHMAAGHATSFARATQRDTIEEQCLNADFLTHSMEMMGTPPWCPLLASIGNDLCTVSIALREQAKVRKEESGLGGTRLVRARLGTRAPRWLA